METQFHSWSEFWAMGGYALYVWLAYGALLLILIWGAWNPWRQHKLLLSRLKAGQLTASFQEDNPQNASTRATA
jgi:heme exporter protein D